MTSIFISLDDDSQPNAQTLTLDSGESFMQIRITDNCAVTLPGYDHVTVKHAFALAEAIRTEAESLKVRLLADEGTITTGHGPQPTTREEL
jgi:hypothetical protein